MPRRAKRAAGGTETQRRETREHKGKTFARVPKALAKPLQNVFFLCAKLLGLGADAPERRARRRWRSAERHHAIRQGGPHARSCVGAKRDERKRFSRSGVHTEEPTSKATASCEEGSGTPSGAAVSLPPRGHAPLQEEFSCTRTVQLFARSCRTQERQTGQAAGGISEKQSFSSFT